MVFAARGWRRGPPHTSMIGCSLKSRLPRPPLPSSPAHAAGRAPGEPGGGPGWRRGRGRGEARARAPLAAGARAARSRRPRRHLFPLRLSVCRWLCPSAAPPLGSPPPAWLEAALRLPGPVPESPGPAGPSCGPGPIVRRSVCPEAGPRDAERRGAPRRRVKRPPSPSLRG